jgi:hypothetical protein
MASPAPTSTPQPGAVPTMTPGVTRSAPDCLIGDACDQAGATTVAPIVGLDCSTLLAATSSFGRIAFDGRQPRGSTDQGEEATVFDAVQRTVDRCGFQVVVEIADQYPDPLHTELVVDAGAALGEIGSLPGGLLCRDLRDLGLTAKNAVDYWFLWSGPDAMDVDLNGVPCETVWPGTAQYLPAWY